MKKINNHRPIDDLTKKTFGWLDKWSFLRKIKSRNFKIAIVAAFLLGLVIAVSMLVSFKVQTRSTATGETAKISVVPSSSSLSVGDNFTADVVLNTNGSSTVAVTAAIKYNPSQLQLVNYDTSGSIFASNNTCIYNNLPCQIIENNAANGSISITLAKPSPGVSTTSGKLATLSFKTLAASTGSIITVAFNGVGDYSDSNVILNDGKSTDFLTSVSNATLVVSGPISTCTSFTYSNWSTCNNGTQTRTIASSLPAGCTGGNPVLSQSCTSSPTCTTLTFKSGSATPATVNESGTYTISCDYGVYKDSIDGYNDLGKCAWKGWNGTADLFTCNAGSAGTRKNSCRLINGTTENVCAQNNPVNDVIVTSTTTSQTCTSFTYSTWSACKGKTQTRSIVSSSPAGCTGGTPILKQSCRK